MQADLALFVCDGSQALTGEDEDRQLLEPRCGAPARAIAFRNKAGPGPAGSALLACPSTTVVCGSVRELARAWTQLQAEVVAPELGGRDASATAPS